MDVTNLKKLVDVVADAGGVLEKVITEKGGMLAKLAHLMPLSGDLVSLAGVDFGGLKAELLLLDDAGKAALLTEFKLKFLLDDKAIMQKIDQALDLAMELEGVVVKAIALAKSLTAVTPAIPSA